MEIIDAHCHLESDELVESLDVIIGKADNAGVVKLITSSVSPRQWELSKSIAEKFKQVEFALGIHPWFSSISDLPQLELLYHAKNIGAVAIGEIGLDKKIDNPDMNIQLKIFQEQLKIAKEINLPVIVHCRGAFNELIEAVKKIGLPEAGGIIHSFSGSAEIAVQFIKYGLSFSLGGILTYKKSRKRTDLLNKIYPDHFLLETDSPDFLPVQIKEQPNMPSNILFNLKAAADILNKSEETVAETTTANAKKIFRI